MVRRMALFFLWILAVSQQLPAAFAQEMMCSQATDLVMRPTATPTGGRINSMQEVVRFLLGESQNSSTTCSDVIIERGLFELGNMTERFSKTFPKDPEIEKLWAAEAAEAFAQYINWWLELDEVRQIALVRILLQIPQESPPSEWKSRKTKWVRDRVGGALFSMISCLIRADKKSDLLANLECIAAQGIEVFSVRVINEWYYWLQVLPEMQRQKTRAEIEKQLEADLTVRQHWAAFATFREQYISADPSKNQQWALPNYPGA